MRRFNPEKARAMGEEINHLLEVKFIREIKEATWLSPPVMVEKKDTKIYRMCIDFTALNKHCPKNYFPLPRIDHIIDSTAGCERLSFLDAYSGYNQIRLKVEDEDKTTFITPHGVYCYITMPFGLKNAGATYQWCMQACLKEEIGRNIEVYVDDIVIKSSKADSLLEDLRETYARGLRLKNYSTHARGLRPSTYARGLLHSTYARGLRLSTRKIQHTSCPIGDNTFKNFTRYKHILRKQSSLSHQTNLIRSLVVALDNDLTRYTIGGLSTSRVVRVHLNTTTRSRRQHLHQVHVNLRIAGSHEEKGNQSPAPQVITNEVVDGLAVLEAAKQRRQTIGLVVQGEYRLMHNGRSSPAGLS
jgi:hypothetical protein